MACRLESRTYAVSRRKVRPFVESLEPRLSPGDAFLVTVLSPWLFAPNPLLSEGEVINSGGKLRTALFSDQQPGATGPLFVGSSSRDAAGVNQFLNGIDRSQLESVHSPGTQDGPPSFLLPPFSETTTGPATNRIDIVFTTFASHVAMICDEVAMSQVLRITTNNDAEATPIGPGDYYTPYRYKDEVVTPNLYYIDHNFGEVTPDYQQGGRFGSYGRTPLENSTIYDYPTDPGGDRGFASPANPNGWADVKFAFETHAWCMKGGDCGFRTFYEGMIWEYQKTAEDQRLGRLGTSTILGNYDPPSNDFLAAFNKFNEVKGYTLCQ